MWLKIEITAEDQQLGRKDEKKRGSLLCFCQVLGKLCLIYSYQLQTHQLEVLSWLHKNFTQLYGGDENSTDF
jgi:hypothetical protein